ncbi:hypothetical protein ZHAS_00014162 [Anopheles sinensis]|uniref:Uncharacterized protein n=1 Tax=Anopheles sinensis TaxID=74873 RepID=A0A084W7G8_ANOSI|nr:hypothetical protein ZHAS_00014162 [Anopheles sinensis]
MAKHRTQFFPSVGFLIAVSILLIGEVKGAVVISRSEADSSAPKAQPVNGGLRFVSVIPSDEKHHRKRDNLLEPAPPAVPVDDSNDTKRRTFTKNQLRPCTFCRFFTTVTPAPKPKIYLNVVRH